MAKRRKSRWSNRKSQRLLLQISILATVLAFIVLYNPVIRAGVNATLVWLVVRGLILAAIVLAIMWTYQFTKPPKVKRRTYKRGSSAVFRGKTAKTSTARRSPKHASHATVPTSQVTATASTNGIPGRIGNQVTPGGSPTPPINPTVQLDDLLVPMSGAHRMFSSGDDDDDI